MTVFLCFVKRFFVCPFLVVVLFKKIGPYCTQGSYCKWLKNSASLLLLQPFTVATLCMELFFVKYILLLFFGAETHSIDFRPSLNSCAIKSLSSQPGITYC